MIERNAHHCDPLMGCAHDLGDLAISACVGAFSLQAVGWGIVLAGRRRDERRGKAQQALPPSSAYRKLVLRMVRDRAFARSIFGA